MIRRLQARDQSALEELYEHAASSALGIALRTLGDSALAEDVVHDAFVALWEEAARLDPERGRVDRLLLTISRRKAIDRARARRRQQTRTADLHDEIADADGDDFVEGVLRGVDRASEVSALARELDALPDDHREVIELAYFQGMTVREIADHLSVPIGTVKSRGHRAMTRLRSSRLQELRVDG